jgi:hypothetical protein
MESKGIEEFVSSKALLKTVSLRIRHDKFTGTEHHEGLIFRGPESGKNNNNNINLHIDEVSRLIESEKTTEDICTTCQQYGLEYLHLLECPATLG